MTNSHSSELSDSLMVSEDTRHSNRANFLPPRRPARPNLLRFSRFTRFDGIIHCLLYSSRTMRLLTDFSDSHNDNEYGPRSSRVFACRILSFQKVTYVLRILVILRCRHYVKIEDSIMRRWKNSEKTVIRMAKTSLTKIVHLEVTRIRTN